MKNITLTLLLLTSITLASQAQMMFDSLLVYYALDGNADDSLQSGIDGTVNAATPTADAWGNPNSAYNFGGTNTSITIPNDAKFAKLNDGFTISLWVNPSSFGTYNVIVSKMNGGSRQLVMRQQSNGAIHVHFEDGGLNHCTSASVMSLGEWQLITLTYDADTHLMTMYHNGMEVHSCETPTKSPDLSTGNWNLGTLTGGNELWDGDIDDLLIWNRAISASEAMALYELGGKYNDLLMSFPMNGNGEDLSPFKNHGTVEGATFVADRFGNEQSALLFDGVDDFVSVPHDENYKIDLPQTFSTWIWLDQAATNTNAIFTSEDRDLGYSGIAVTTNTLGGISASYMINGCACSQSRRTAVMDNPITEKEWHQVTVVFKGAADIDIYVDAVLQDVTFSGTGGAMGFDMTTNANASIGAYDKSDVLDTRYFTGALDDLRLYKRELNSNEITESFSPGNFVDPLITSTNTSEDLFENAGLFPNPFDASLHVNLDGLDGAQLSLFDATGSEVLSQDINSSSSIDVEGLKKGLYIARITTAQGIVSTTRVQKQ